MPGTVVWDLGGVLLRWDPYALITHALAGRGGDRIPAGLLPPGTHPPQDPAIGALVSAVFQDFTPDSDWSAFDRGVLDSAGLRTRICDRTGLGRALVTAILDGIPSHLEFRAETEQVIDRVVAAGHRVVFLSNMPPPYADWLEAEPRFTGRLPEGVFSCRVRAVKPEPEIYRIAEDVLDLHDGAVVMIDDRPVNLTPAVARGWDGVHFRDAEQSVGELERLGWL